MQSSLQRTGLGAAGLCLVLQATACSPRGQHSSPAVTQASSGAGAEERPAKTFHWNPSIEWLPLEDAKQKAADGKPIMVLIYADWCGDSSSFVNHVLADPAVAEASKRFAMVRVDKTREPELSELLASDIEYVPSVLFLDGAGKRLDVKSLDGTEGEYTYDYRRPTPLLDGMQKAIASAALGSNVSRESSR